MAEILQHNQKQKTSVAKIKKASLKVDLTPMVDLGFLLISFFVFTTTLAKPTAMRLTMPDDNTKDSSQAPVSKTLNIILGGNNNEFYYEGDSLNKLKNIGTKLSSLRDVISNKKEVILKRFGSNSDIIILIKPTKDATYANVINVLDEMVISNVKTYMLIDASKNELMAIEK